MSQQLSLGRSALAGVQTSQAKPRLSPRTARGSITCSQRETQGKNTSSNTANTAVKFASVVGAAALVLAPFNGPAYARPSDFIQSQKNDGKLTKFDQNVSIGGSQARAPSTRKLKPNPTQQSTSRIPDKATDISPLDLAPDAQQVGRK